jgi:hypothetical protein
MADVTQGIDAYFYLSALTILVGGIGLIVRYSYKSKCKEVECCCIKIVRDVEAEEREDMEETKRPTSPSIK